MATLPPGFLEALATKYAVLDRDSQARTAQETAQTREIAPNAAAQRAVQGAQAGQIAATTATVDPLARSQIANTNANIGETQARTGLFGAQQQSTLHDLFGAPEDALRSFGTSVLGLPSAGSSGTGNVIGGAPTTTQNQHSILETGTGAAGLYSKGTTSVPPSNASRGASDGSTPGDFANSYAAGGNIQPVTLGQPTPKQPRGMTPPLAPGYADGVASVPFGRLGGVPAPGQTVTSGSWTGPTPAPAATGNQLATAAGLGPRVPRPQSYTKGTAKVPGKGSSKVDTVPAMLAPKEAVLNEKGADLIGRANITAANAAGNHIAGFAKGVTHVGRGLMNVLSAMGDAKAKEAPATKGMP